MMFTKYHQMGGALGVAACPDSVAFFSKIKPKEVKVFLKFPFKMSPTLIWYFTRGLKPSNYLDPMLTD